MDFSQFTSKEAKEVLKILKTQETGLSKKEAQKRQRIYGFNEIKVKEVGLFDIFLRQFKSPFFYLLFIAAFLAFLIGEQVNGLIILGFVFINVFLSFFQEARAGKNSFPPNPLPPHQSKARYGTSLFARPSENYQKSASGFSLKKVRILFKTDRVSLRAIKMLILKI